MKRLPGFNKARMTGLPKSNVAGSMAMLDYGERLAQTTVTICCSTCGEFKPVNGLDRLQHRFDCYDCRPAGKHEKGPACPHTNTRAEFRGGYHFSEGEPWDDVREVTVCTDCGREW